MNIEVYNYVRSGGLGFHTMPRGLIAVWGAEAKQFLDGMITNDMKTLEDGAQMLAAFPNAQGRLIAVVRVLRQGERYLFETESATHEVLYNSLFRFTFAGDFFVEDLSEVFSYYELFGIGPEPPEGALVFDSPVGKSCFVPGDLAGSFEVLLSDSGAVPIDDETYETLRIEAGIPKYGVDMDDATIVPELGLDGMISYNKGCYVGQEIIARIHFRGHVAKQLTGLVIDQDSGTNHSIAPGAELTSADGKNAGRITSVAFSPKLGKTVALGFARYAHIEPGTVLRANDQAIVVTGIPLVN